MCLDTLFSSFKIKLLPILNGISILKILYEGEGKTYKDTHTHMHTPLPKNVFTASQKSPSSKPKLD